MSIKTGDSGTPRFLRDNDMGKGDQKLTQKNREVNNLGFADYAEIKVEKISALGGQSSDLTDQNE